MKLFPFQRNSATIYSLVDVGLETVKAGVAQFSDQGTIELVGHGIAQSHQRDLTGGRAEAEALVEAVDEALTQAEDFSESVVGYKIVPDDVLVALPARSTVGQLFIIELKRANPQTPITAKELKQLRGKAKSLAQKNLSQLALEEGQWQTLPLAESGLELDGQPVIDGIGRTGQIMAFKLWGMVVQPQLLRAVDMLTDKLSLNSVQTIPSVQALAALLRRQEAIILDVGASGTTVVLIQDSILQASHWLPFGGNFFNRAILKTIDVKADMVESLKRSLSAGELNQKERTWLNSHLKSPRQRWGEAILEILLDLSPDHALPRQLYLTGGSSRLAGLDSWLQTKQTTFNGAPEISRLSGQGISTLKIRVTDLDSQLFATILGLALELRFH